MRRLSYRQLLGVAIAVILVAAALLGIGLATGTGELVATAAFLVPFGLVAYLMLHVRTLQGQVMRLEGQSSTERNALSSTVREVAASRREIVRAVREMVAAERRDRRASDQALGSELKQALQARRDRVASREFSELEAFLDLRQLLEPRAPMPPTRGWAASPDVLRTLVELIFDCRPSLVVECGSGASSIWLGYALERVGSGRLVSLEHDEDYTELTSRRVAVHGLGDVVEVRHAPLEPWTGSAETWQWYSLNALKDLHDIGLVFVDGPPGDTHAHARYPAAPILLERCAAAAVLVLDDANRPEEREISDRWLAEHPDLRLTRLRHEKGCDVFSRTPT